MWSRHVHLDSSNACSTEVEFSFGRSSWASIALLDPGTQRVVSDGCRVLYDPEGILAQLTKFVSAQS